MTKLLFAFAYIHLQTTCADQQKFEDTIEWLTAEIENLVSNCNENSQYKQKMSLRRCLDRWGEINDLIDITRRRYAS